MRSQLCPPFVVFHTCCDEVYSTFGSTGEKMIGYVHCQRSLSALDGSPENIRGYGFTSRRCPVRLLSRWRNEPLLPPAKNTSTSFGSGATYPGSAPPALYIAATAAAPPPPPPRPPPPPPLFGRQTVLPSRCAPHTRYGQSFVVTT